MFEHLIADNQSEHLSWEGNGGARFSPTNVLGEGLPQTMIGQILDGLISLALEVEAVDPPGYPVIEPS